MSRKKTKRQPAPAAASPAAGAEAPLPSAPVPVHRAWLLAAALTLLLAGLACYWTSFGGVFLLDDWHVIERRAAQGTLWPVWQHLHFRPRSLGYVTLGLNYYFGGLKVGGWHAVNLGIHLVTALLLLATLRRVLAERVMPVVCRENALLLAWGTALLWTVHPLNTQAVTYICQRFEALAALFYLLAVYGAVRALQAWRDLAAGSWRRLVIPGLWAGVTGLALAGGWLSKETIVTAPAFILVYAWVCHNPAGWRRLRSWRFWLPAGVLLGLVAAVALMRLPAVFDGTSAARDDYGVRTAGSYLLTQPSVLLHYLQLAAWPQALAFDYYDWPVARSLADAWLPGLIVCALVLVTVWGVVRQRPWSLAGAWFFGILSVTSSFIPIADLAFEHRMYLPLAGVIGLAAAWLRSGLGRLPARGFLAKPVAATALFAFLALVLALPLGWRTARRNLDYGSTVAMWTSVVKARPGNARAWDSLGTAHTEAKNNAKAEECYRRALELEPDFVKACTNLGNLAYARGDLKAAEALYLHTLSIKPRQPEALSNLSAICIRRGQYHKAIEYATAALKIRRFLPEAQTCLDMARKRLAEREARKGGPSATAPAAAGRGRPDAVVPQPAPQE